MTLTKLRIDILQNDLAIRFGISRGKVAHIYHIVKLSKELGILII